MKFFPTKILLPKARSWKSVERFDDRWRGRIKQMSGFISKNDTSVVDLGCGPMWLKDYLEADVTYTGVDYKNRGPNTIICDLNKDCLPELYSDVYFISGCLEYIHSPSHLVQEMSRQTLNRCIISYCSVNHFSDQRLRRKKGWVNHLTEEQLIDLFISNDMSLQNQCITADNNSIFVFLPNNKENAVSDSAASQ